MKILQLNIEGFRSLKNVEWKPGDLNVVIGPNASGKSNLLKALEFISASARGELANTVQRMGGMQSLKWDGSANYIQFHINYGVYLTSKLFSSSYRFLLNDTGAFHDSRIGKEYLYELNNYKPNEHWQGTDDKIIERDEYRTDRPAFPILLASGKPDETYLSRMTNEISESAYNLKQYLASWSTFNRLVSDETSVLRVPPIARYETRLNKDGQNLVSVLHTLYTENHAFEKAIDDAMHAVFGAEFVKLIFPPAADQRVQMRIEWRSLKQKQNTAAISDGTLQYLFLIAALAHPEPPPLIAFDEPETGLHPRMFGIIAEYAADAALKTQVVFTTHSAEFLDAMTQFQPTTTIALWENGETLLKTVDQENLAYWLKDYRLGEMFWSGQLEAIA